MCEAGKGFPEKAVCEAERVKTAVHQSPHEDGDSRDTKCLPKKSVGHEWGNRKEVMLVASRKAIGVGHISSVELRFLSPRNQVPRYET